MLPAENSPGPSLHFGGGFFSELSPPVGLRLRSKDAKADNPGGLRRCRRAHSIWPLAHLLRRNRRRRAGYGAETCTRTDDWPNGA